MKKSMFLFGALFAAGLSFTACSSDNESVEGGISPTGDGASYIALSIVLPNDAAGTRAPNDDFKNGLASEFAVNSIKAFIFEGGTSSSVLSEVLEPAIGSWSVNSDGNNITSRRSFVQKLTKSVTSPYVLIVLNDCGITYTAGTSTYEAIASQTVNKYVSTDGGVDYFTMTNSPLASASGGTNDPSSATVSTLVAANTYETQAAANAATPNEIYVERVAAKVTVDVSRAGTQTTVDNKAFSILSWSVDNTESTSYFVRNVDGVSSYFGYKNADATGANQYRFVGSADTGGGYRIYWAKDPNYTGTGLATSRLTAYSSLSANFGSSNPQYCLENTFDLSNQTLNHTTRVVIAAQFNNGNNFYVINGATSTLYSDVATVQSNLAAAVLSNSKVHAIISASSETWVSTEIGITLSSVDAKGIVKIADIGWNHASTTLTSQLEAIESTVISEVNASNKVEFYDSGTAYYTVLIKHFGDDLAKWKATGHAAAGGIYDYDHSSAIDATDEAQYLGRYGVLRNNWYNITVSGIKRIGSPVVVDVTGDTTTDDTVDQYIAYAINILAWAYRNQDENL